MARRRKSPTNLNLTRQQPRAFNEMQALVWRRGPDGETPEPEIIAERINAIMVPLLRKVKPDMKVSYKDIVSALDARDGDNWKYIETSTKRDKKWMADNQEFFQQVLANSPKIKSLNNNRIYINMDKGYALPNRDARVYAQGVITYEQQLKSKWNLIFVGHEELEPAELFSGVLDEKAPAHKKVYRKIDRDISLTDIPKYTFKDVYDLINRWNLEKVQEKYLIDHLDEIWFQVMEYIG